MTKNRNDNRVRSFQDSVNDTMDSQYKHKIYYKQKPDPMSGYSKKAGYREKQNPTENFTNYVLRLMMYGYYPGSAKDIDEMEFFQLQNNILIVRMLPGVAVWEPQFITDDSWKRARWVIDTMFNLIEKKISPLEILGRLKVQRSQRVEFDPKDLSPRFTNDNALVKFGEAMLKKGYPPGEVESFMRSYREKHFGFRGEQNAI